jgi:hypothetical protein
MADIAQIYLLPPPVRSPATDRALAPRNTAPEDGSQRAGASVNEQISARRFRFRVYEGGETSDTGTDLDTRRAGTAPGLSASDINLGNSDSLDARPGLGGHGTTFSNSRGGASSAFLAQSIAQQQLGEGLHNPPYATATSAYSRTGAALNPRPSAGVDISV